MMSNIAILSLRRGLRSGFSLMELLLVVTIIGVIAAIVVPRVAAPTATAREKVRASQIGQMNQIIERYHLDNDAWPTNITDLVPAYLPDGTPVDPDGGSYAINGTTHRIEYTP